MKYFVRYEEGLFKQISGDRRIDQLLLIDRDQKELSESKAAVILALMLRHRRSTATDPRGKLFALLGLTEPSHLNGLDVRVDYTIEPVEVFTRFATSHIQHTQDLNILSVPRLHSQEGVQGLLSWVPDCSVWDGTISLRWEEILEPESLHQPFDAAAGTKTMPRFSADRKALILKGVIINTISRVSVVIAADEGVYHMDPDTKTLADLAALISKGLTEVDNWDSIGSAHDKKSIYTSNGEPLSEVYYQTIYGGHAPWPRDLVRQQHKQEIKERRMNRFVHGFKFLQKRPKLYLGSMMVLVELDG